jgi:hypothetical protein
MTGSSRQLKIPLPRRSTLRERGSAMIEELHKLLTTFTEESQNAGRAKVAELNLNPNAGVVPLDESFINLSYSRDILLDAIEHRKLIQLPITVQQTLLKNLNEISRAQASLLGGTDEVANLTGAIEQLNTAMWTYGLHNLSPEVLGYQQKLNQLKNQELRAANLQSELEKGLALKARLESVLTTSESSMGKIQESERTASETLQRITDAGQQATTTEQSIKTTLANAEQAASAAVTNIEQKTTSIVESVQRSDTTATQLLASTKTANAEVIAIQPKINEFFGEITANRQKLASIIEDAERTVADNNAQAKGIIEGNRTQTEELIAELKRLEAQIDDQIRRATGHSLFHSFQTRQEALKRSVQFWGWVLAVTVVCAVGAAVFLVLELRDAPVNGLFFLKLSLSLPIAYWIGFCTVQYGRERRAEEEYAFKANISISLNPYQELVNKIINSDDPKEREKYTAFIVDSITKVFTSPTDKIFSSAEREPRISNKLLKQIAEIAGAFTREVKH